jgi:hypothetical protein
MTTYKEFFLLFSRPTEYTYRKPTSKSDYKKMTTFELLSFLETLLENLLLLLFSNSLFSLRGCPDQEFLFHFLLCTLFLLYILSLLSNFSFLFLKKNWATTVGLHLFHKKQIDDCWCIYRWAILGSGYQLQSWVYPAITRRSVCTPFQLRFPSQDCVLLTADSPNSPWRHGYEGNPNWNGVKWITRQLSFKSRAFPNNGSNDLTINSRFSSQKNNRQPSILILYDEE